MIDGACLAEGQAELFTDILSGGLAGLLLSMLLVAAAIALVAAPLVLRRYDMQVRRLMRLQQRAVLPAAWVAKQARIVSPSAADESDLSLDHSTLTELEIASKWRQANVRRATWLAYGVFIATSAVLVPLISTLATPDLVGYFIAVCFMGAVPAFVNVRPHGSKTLVLVASLVLGIVLSLLEAA